MPQDQERLKYLVKQYTDKTCTWEEMQEFLSYVKEEANKETLYSLMDEHYERIEPEVSDKVDWEGVFQRIEEKSQPRTVRLWSWQPLAAAAAILLCLCYGAFFWLSKQTDQQGGTDTVATALRDVAPGGNKALLTLSDGSQIVLDNAETGILATQGVSSVNKAQEGQLIYNLSNKELGEQPVVYNTITTPRGGQYQVVLPDGTKVWLNAASSLRFPTAFTGVSREVELTGEGYFEVAKNRTMPFVVQTGDMKVQVLGTHFNIMAYANESSNKTTLFEGAVRVTNGASSLTLKPGQQVQLNEQGVMKLITDFDIEEPIAWKQGQFQFNDTDLGYILRQLERWYDIKVDYTQVPAMHFNGVISRNVNLSKVLKMLEITGDVKFEQENNTLKVVKGARKGLK